MITLAVAGVAGVAAGATASQLWTVDGRLDSASALDPSPTAPSQASTTPPIPVTPTMVPTTTAEPITPPPPPTSRTVVPTTTAPPTPLSQAVLRLSDWRRGGLGSPAHAGARRTVSECQAGSLGSFSGVRSTRYSRVTSGVLTGSEALAETSTPAQADTLLRAVVAWRDTCNPSAPSRAHLSTSSLVQIPLEASGQAYRWTFVFNTAADFGNALIEEVIVSRSGNRVAVVVVSTEVPMATSRSIKQVNVQALARAATERLT